MCWEGAQERDGVLAFLACTRSLFFEEQPLLIAKKFPLLPYLQACQVVNEKELSRNPYVSNPPPVFACPHQNAIYH